MPNNELSIKLYKELFFKLYNNNINFLELSFINIYIYSSKN